MLFFSSIICSFYFFQLAGFFKAGFSYTLFKKQNFYMQSKNSICC
ncbi:hypothetical protein RV14_GL001041 [Enterococcus ratti]|uniref:Uncharacterized protein n=1 Tax=Enterococcus ratti TaxID=150033 RepID=A0A1L8WDW4_9ENTE|nr:hypothetical protein RV14_GL001041 [Enterococcus ratti]